MNFGQEDKFERVVLVEENSHQNHPIVSLEVPEEVPMLVWLVLMLATKVLVV